LGTVEQELLYAIRAMEVLLESGVGVSEVMRHVADEDYGDLSTVFKEILDDIDKGSLQVDAIRKAMLVTKSPGLKKILSTMAMSLEEDIDTVDRIRSIAEKEGRERKVKVDGFVESLSSTSDQFLIVSIMLPLFAVIGGVVNAMMSSSEDSPIGGGMSIPVQCIPLMFIISIIIMFVMVFGLKKNEPKV